MYEENGHDYPRHINFQLSEVDVNICMHLAFPEFDSLGGSNKWSRIALLE